MHLLNSRPFQSGVVVIIFATLLWYSFGLDKPLLLAAIDNRIFDEMFRFRGTSPAAGEVVIVDIDEKSLAAHGQWPWPRHTVARLMRALNEAQAKAVGFDIVFSERDRTTPEVYFNRHTHLFDSPESRRIMEKAVTNPQWDHDIQLGDAMAKGNTVAGYAFLFKDDKLKRIGEAPFPSITLRLIPDTWQWEDLTLITAYRPVLNIPEIATSASEGFFNVFPDPSGTVRQVPLFISMDGVPYPSLALEMYRLGENISGVTLEASQIGGVGEKPLLGAHIGDRFIATDRKGQVTVNFRGPAYTFPYLSASDIIAKKKWGLIRGRHVLIGSSAAGIMDFVATPFSPIFPGVEVHATVIDNLLNNDPMVHERFTEVGLTYALILGGGLLITLLLVLFPPLSGSLSAALIPAAILLGNYIIYFKNSQLVGICYPLAVLSAIFMVVTIVNYFSEGIHRQYIKNAFSLYVSPSVVAQLIKDPKRLSLSIDRREVTIFFSDIRGFTTLSEQLPPEQLGIFMNDYLTVVSDIIMAHGGMVDKYIGDAVMAVWGTPIDNPTQADDAVTAALSIKEALSEFTELWAPLGITAATGIGLNTGIVSAGNFGSAKRFDYTVLGDAVNLSARLEGLNKLYGAEIIISENTLKKLQKAVFTRRLDTVCVKGKTEAVNIYEPLCHGEPADQLKEEVEQFHQALDLYTQKAFPQALDAMERLFESHPITLYALYVKRISRFIEEPPTPEWEGVHILESK